MGYFGTYQVFPKVFAPLFSANLRSCAALNYNMQAPSWACVSDRFISPSWVISNKYDSWARWWVWTNARYTCNGAERWPVSGGWLAALLPKVMRR